MFLIESLSFFLSTKLKSVLNLPVNNDLYEQFQQKRNEQQQQQQQLYQSTPLPNHLYHSSNNTSLSCLSQSNLHVGFSPGYTPPTTVKLKEKDKPLIQRSSHVLELNINPDNSNQFHTSTCVMEDEALFGDIPTFCSNDITFCASEKILDDNMVFQELEWITQLSPPSLQLPLSPPLSPSDFIPLDDFVLFP